jgi:hypothetical protein
VALDQKCETKGWFRTENHALLCCSTDLRWGKKRKSQNWKQLKETEPFIKTYGRMEERHRLG